LLFISCITGYSQQIYITDQSGKESYIYIENEQQHKQRLVNDFLYQLFSAKDANEAKAMINNVLTNHKVDIEQCIRALQRIYIIQCYLMDSVELEPGSYIDENGCLIYEDGILVVN